MTTEEDRQQAAIDAAADRLVERAEQIRREASASNGACTDCKWFLNRFGDTPKRSPMEDEWFRCMNPVVALPRFDPHTGAPSQAKVSIFDARDERGLCGPTGMLFETRRSPEEVSRWRFTIFGIVAATLLLILYFWVV